MIMKVIPAAEPNRHNINYVANRALGNTLVMPTCKKSGQKWIYSFYSALGIVKIPRH